MCGSHGTEASGESLDAIEKAVSKPNDKSDDLNTRTRSGASGARNPGQTEQPDRPSQDASPGMEKTSTVVENKNLATAGNEKTRTWLHEAFQILGDQWFLITLGILIAIASQVQVPSSSQELKRTVTSYLCISIIFFVTGSTLDTKVLLKNYGRWKINLFVQIQCFLMTSALVFGLVSAVATSRFMDPGLLVGFIFMSCVATTISSNIVMTRQAHGNQALAVVQTTVGNLIGAFISPSLVVMYTSVPTWYNTILPPESGHWASLYRRVMKQLGLSIFVPLVAGQLFRNVFPKTCKKLFINWKLVKLGQINLLVLLWATYDQAFASDSFSAVKTSNMIFVVFVSVALWIVFFLIALFTSNLWLPREDTVAICYCVPAKGIVMGVPLSTTIFAGISLSLQSTIQIPIVIYQGLQLAFGSILVPIFRKWIEAKRKREQQHNDTSQTEEAKDEGVG